MTEEKFFSLIPAKRFFADYCPDVANWKHKRRKVDGNKKPIDFTPEEKKQIQQAAKRLGKDLTFLKM